MLHVFFVWKFRRIYHNVPSHKTQHKLFNVYLYLGYSRVEQLNTFWNTAAICVIPQTQRPHEMNPCTWENCWLATAAPTTPESSATVLHMTYLKVFFKSNEVVPLWMGRAPHNHLLKLLKAFVCKKSIVQNHYFVREQEMTCNGWCPLTSTGRPSIQIGSSQDGVALCL